MKQGLVFFKFFPFVFVPYWCIKFLGSFICFVVTVSDFSRHNHRFSQTALFCSDLVSSG